MSLNDLMDTHRRWMHEALAEAEAAADTGDVPVGAIVVNDGEIVGRGRNRVEERGDPTAHAEILAIQEACATLGTKHLPGSTIYVTLEPCPMCAGAIVLTRLNRLVFGALDEKSGAASTLYAIPRDSRLNHQVDLLSGVEADRAGTLLEQFFTQRRTKSAE
jgi:tRNA(adenine34) deaminase